MPKKDERGNTFKTAIAKECSINMGLNGERSLLVPRGSRTGTEGTPDIHKYREGVTNLPQTINSNYEITRTGV